MSILNPVCKVNNVQIYEVERNGELWFLAYVNGKEIANRDVFLVKKLVSIRSR